MNDHIMFKNNNKSKKKEEERTCFLKNWEGHNLYMILQGTVCQVGLTNVTK